MKTKTVKELEVIDVTLEDLKRLLEKAEQYKRVNTEGSYIIPDGVGGWKRADEKEVNYQYTTDTK